MTLSPPCRSFSCLVLCQHVLTWRKTLRSLLRSSIPAQLSQPVLLSRSSEEMWRGVKLPATTLVCCCLQISYTIPYTPQFYMYKGYIYRHHHGQPHTLLGSHWNSHTSVLNNLILEFLPSRMKMQFFPRSCWQK